MTAQGGAGSSGAAGAARRGGRGSGGGSGRRRQRRQIDDALVVAHGAHAAVVRAHLRDLYGARREIELAAAHGEPAELEEVGARAAAPERDILDVDERFAEANSRPSVGVLDEVVAAEPDAPLLDVEGDLVAIVGGEARRLEALHLDLALGLERLQAQRALLRDLEAGRDAQAHRLVGRRAGRVREAVHGDRDVAHGRLELRLDGLVDDMEGRVLEREVVDGEAEAFVLLALLVLLVLRVFALALLLSLALLLAFLFSRLLPLLLSRGALLGTLLPPLGARLGGLRLWRGEHVFQVERAVALAPRVHLQAGEHDLLDVEPLRAEIALAEHDVELLEREQRARPRGVLLLHVDVIEPERPLHGELGRVVRATREPEVERERQPGRLDGERELQRHEGQVARQIERLQPQLEHGLEGLLEGLRSPRGDEGRAVDDDAEAGLDERVEVHG